MNSRSQTWLVLLSVIFFYYSSTSQTHLCFAADTISSGQSLTLNQTLISNGSKFELGFFRPGTSLNYYLGIWYKQISVQNKTVVWVANRETPLTDPTSSELKLLENGNLVLLNKSKIAIWSSESTSNANVSSEGVLGDDGNFVLRTEVRPSDVFWQSFDYPTDTFLPGAKIGYNRITNKKLSLTSWKNSNDPARGLYSLELDRSVDQYFIQSNQNRYWNSGAWNETSLSFSLIPEMTLNSNFNFSFFKNENETYFISSAEDTNSRIFSRLVMNYSGQFNQLSWVGGAQAWFSRWSQPRQQCEVYRYCGEFGICQNNNASACTCLNGFQPQSPLDWNLNEFSGGCLRKISLQCGDNVRFLPVHLVIETSNQRLNDDIQTPDNCKQSCLNACSCNAYAYNTSCLLWNESLFNLQRFQDGNGGISVQLRLAASEIPSPEGKKPLKAYIIVLIAGSILLCILGCFLFAYKMKQRRKMKYRSRETPLAVFSIDQEAEQSKSELPSFDLSTVAAATNNFSNKLGEGGFGSVYKGKLQDEREIAVKRLSRSSGQGVEEFKNELMLISKLQHRNLVRLLGYCIDSEEKILLYEYMPNKSLDAFLFDPNRKVLLDWSKRFNIIDGIARGLLYLHRDSRLKVIHRDLKASNILLDEDMIPKISDFGMARIFGGKQTLANTNRVVGTYGYMSPEYAMEGTFSEKSDVFSFGVMVLEIVSSKKNSNFYFLEESYNLLGYVWQKWNENKLLEIMDPTLSDSYNLQELMRCIYIGLLCVQDHVFDRPTMTAIVSMLGSEGTLPLPRQPAFTIERTPQLSGNLFNINGTISGNFVTITKPEGR